MSHEAVRSTCFRPKLNQPKCIHSCKVLFAETDGLYMKRQRHKRRGQELKIAAVHEGCEVNGKHVKLKNKHYYTHQEKESFGKTLKPF